MTIFDLKLATVLFQVVLPSFASRSLEVPLRHLAFVWFSSLVIKANNPGLGACLFLYLQSCTFNYFPSVSLSMPSLMWMSCSLCRRTCWRSSNYDFYNCAIMQWYTLQEFFGHTITFFTPPPAILTQFLFALSSSRWAGNITTLPEEMTRKHF